MSIKSYDKNTIVLEIKNDTNVEWLYGGEYEIQKMIFQDDWLPLEFSGVFNLIGYPLEENDVKEVEINFEYGYGELEPGVYCISKGFSLWDDNLRKEQTVEIVKYCTFEIK